MFAFVYFFSCFSMPSWNDGRTTIVPFHWEYKRGRDVQWATAGGGVDNLQGV